MKTFKNTGILSLFFLLFFSTGNLMSQNLLQEDPSPKIEEMAKERTDMWIKELSLTSKQADLMERKIIEYTMKRTDLMQSKMNEEAKKERFIALQLLEEKDMRDILTGPQHEKYLRLNRQTTDEDDNNPE